MRPYGQHARAPARSTTLPTPDDAAAAAAEDRSTQNTTECPTQQPYVATQLSNGNGSSGRNRSANQASSGGGDRAPDDPWPYTQMLVVVASSGVGLLFLNAVVVVCLVAVRRRAPYAGGEKRADGAQYFERAASCGRPGDARDAGPSAPDRVESVSSIIDLTCPHVKAAPFPPDAPTPQPAPCNNRPHGAVELYDCYACDQHRQSRPPEAFCANHNEITV